MSKPWTTDEFRVFALKQAVKYACNGPDSAVDVEVEAEKYLTFLLTGNASPKSALSAIPQSA